MIPSQLMESVRPGFRALTLAVAPAAATLDEAGWRRAEEIVVTSLRDRPPAMLRQLRLFFRVLDLLSLARFGRPFRRLDPVRARRLLGALERAPVLLLRRGLWGVRTLAFMGYYGQSDVQRAVGYAAHPGGWGHRGADAGPWSDREGAAAPEATTLTADDPESREDSNDA